MASNSTPARVAVLLITIVVALVLLLANTVGASGSDRGTATDTLTHRVVGGDTLWDIATAHTPEGDDVRKTVFEMRRLNDLDGSVIVPGQVLHIPAPD